MLPVTTKSELDLQIPKKIPKTNKWTCCQPKKKTHKHKLTRYEIDYSVQERANKILVDEKKKET